jgi:hypothetical protein
MFIKLGSGLLLHVSVMLWMSVAICVPFACPLLEISKPRCYLVTPFFKYRLRSGAPKPQGLWNRPHIWRLHESEGKHGQSGRAVGMFRIFHVVVLRDTFP